ncbi:hypothetical protein [Brevundimonas sp. LM2]|uniref:hypothetical protein n=1 Tax=Brevundimonas sp. LM2 TaxID=1938605 RepID=UPI0009865936|nr:hypothetical protein [Brevundimonas sp. LM2]
MLLASLAAAIALQAGWTWTLYDGEGPLVLAHEIPDTPQLKATFECQPGSGVARLSLYGNALDGGFANLSAGQASAAAQARVDTDHLSLALRTEHPVFAQFIRTGTIDVAVAGVHRLVEVPSAHRAKLRRFAELCTG